MNVIEGLLLQVLIFAVSLVVLALASHYTILAVEKLVELTGLSEISVGFVILAVLTSIPELTVALFSIIQGEPGISIGDILGSNVFNVGAVLGILGLLGFLKTCCTDLLLDLTDILFITSLIPLLLVIFNIASPLVGILLLATFVVNTYLMAKKRTPAVSTNGGGSPKRLSKIKVILFLILGLASIIVAARLVVSSGIEIALFLGAPPILLGAKVVAVGTSLPELTTDFAAVRRGHVHLAIGGVIGSNLTNLTLVLGLVLLTSPFAVNMTIFTEILPFLLITTIIFWRFLIRGGISKFGGIILIISYVLFQVIIQPV
jgi:cation:H+ antiporter